jgi:multiple sugar transport system ATP-binding protein
MGFGLKLHGVPKPEIRKRVEEAAQMLAIADLLKRKPGQLSGGQRQRVAMGRAIVREPDAFLMDEPLSNLDAKLRVEMRSYIALLHQRIRTTTLYVTHDQTEAMTMGDRVAVMRRGHIEQVDIPQQLYDRPANLFVAGFIGSPAMNLLEGTLQRQNGSYMVELGAQRIEIDPEGVAAHPALDGFVGRDLIIGIRPEDLEDASLATDAPANRRLRGRVVLREALGSEIVAHVAIDAKAAVTEDVRELAEDTDAVTVGDLEDKATDGTEVIGRFNARSRAHQGDEVEVAVDTRALHFFDPETGLGIYDANEGGTPA